MPRPYEAYLRPVREKEEAFLPLARPLLDGQGIQKGGRGQGLRPSAFGGKDYFLSDGKTTPILTPRATHPLIPKGRAKWRGGGV